MLRFYTALISARLILFMMKVLRHKGGTSFIGMAVLKICPNFLKYCKKYISYSAAVTGTNGKTTTSGLLAQIYKQDGNRVIHNTQGANMLTGIANMFALNIKLSSHKDVAVIESDEAYLTKLYDFLKPDYLVVTNLFRDQLDRYGELSTTASFIQNAIDKSDSTILVLNADDPLVANFGKNKKAIYYGIEDVEYHSNKHNHSSCAPTEVFNCICNNPLEYDKQFFAQEGHYHCSSCGYKRPEPDCKAHVKIYDNHSEIKVVWNKNSYEFKLNLVGLYNVYNALGAITCAFASGVEYEPIKQAVSNYKSIFGRAEKRIINGHNTLIQLIKNPTGASEVLKTVDLNSNIIVAINDNYADGRDISWLWDSDFEQLKEAKKLVITSGIRAKDMALRLKYAGIEQDKIQVVEDIKQAIEIAASSDNMEDITILPSYTALLSINKMKF